MKVRVIPRLDYKAVGFIVRILPEGWSAECEKNVYLRHWFDNYKLDDEPTPVRIKIRAGENVDAINRGILEVTAPGRPTVGYIPLIIPG